MVTLQDISSQLMKPAKDLADWKFPLSQILEEYYTLLDDPDSVNFSEAALVLQNSTNVYVRRVEYLYSEISTLQQLFNHCFEENSKQTSKNDKKSASSTYFDLSDFKPLNLEEEVGKDINIKSQSEMKPVKLMSQRFTQLEKSGAHLHNPIEIYDIHGEVVGNKYDFRCNQPVNIHGILVADLSPEDFCDGCNSPIENTMQDSATCSEANTDRTESSGYFSHTTEHDSTNLNCSTLINGEIDSMEECDSLSVQDSRSNTPETTVAEQTTPILENTDETQHSSDSTRQYLTTDDLTVIQDRTTVNANLKVLDTSKEQCSNDQTTTSDSTTANSDNDIQNNNVDPKSEHLQKLSDSRTTRKQKSEISRVNDLNNKLWEPIPLTSNRENVCDNTSPRKKSGIQTLKTERRKRKLISRFREEECLAEFLIHEIGLSRKSTSSVSSPKPNFTPLKTEELEEFQEGFENCFKQQDTVHQEALANITMDLLGFRINTDKKISVSNEHESSSDEEITMSDITHLSNELHSQNSCDSNFETDISSRLAKYQELVESKMKELLDECKEETELERTIAEWHDSIKPKLEEEERKPAFRIHDYTARIVEILQGANKRKLNFETVVRGQPVSEVARYFLASLQLASTHNVDLNAKENDDNIEIVLLD